MIHFLCSRLITGKLKDDLKNGPWGEIEKFPVWEKISDMIESELQRGKNKKFKSNFTEAKETVLDPLLESIDGSMVLWCFRFY